MKNPPMVIGIPVLVIVVVIGSVFAWRLGQTSIPKSLRTQVTEDITLIDESESPSSSFGSEESSDIADMQQDLESTVDDGGTADLNDLQKDAEGL